jgi:hypothetical protein
MQAWMCSPIFAAENAILLVLVRGDSGWHCIVSLSSSTRRPRLLEIHLHIDTVSKSGTRVALRISVPSVKLIPDCSAHGGHPLLSIHSPDHAGTGLVGTLSRHLGPRPPAPGHHRLDSNHMIPQHAEDTWMGPWYMCCLRSPIMVYRAVGQPTSWLVATPWVSPRCSRGRGSSRGQLPGRDEVQIYHRRTVPNWWDGAITPVIDPTLNEGPHRVCD